MKKQFFLAAIATLFCFAVSNAQGGGGFQRKTPEERLKTIHVKIDSAFKLPADKLAQVDSIFLSSFKAQDAKINELRAGGGTFDRDAMMAARKQLNDDRDAKLKAVFTNDQFNTWKNDIEPTTRPQRGGGGGKPQQ